MEPEHFDGNLNGGQWTNHRRYNWFVVAVCGTLLTTVVGIWITNINAYNDRIISIEKEHARTVQELKQLDVLLGIVRTEQVARTDRFGTIGERLTTIEINMRITNERLTTMSSRILGLAERVDRLSDAPGRPKKPHEDRPIEY